MDGLSVLLEIQANMPTQWSYSPVCNREINVDVLPKLYCELQPIVRKKFSI